MEPKDTENHHLVTELSCQWVFPSQPMAPPNPLKEQPPRHQQPLSSASRIVILLTFSCTVKGEGRNGAFYNQIIFARSSAIMLMHGEAQQMVQSQLRWC